MRFGDELAIQSSSKKDDRQIAEGMREYGSVEALFPEI
jgi:hypothetical protein